MSKPLPYANPPTKCDLCKRPVPIVFYDAYVPRAGQWGFMCSECYYKENGRVGLGRGQRYERFGNDTKYYKTDG